MKTKSIKMEAERERHILNKIESVGLVQVNSLAEELDVSSMTIRRDLARLKVRGLLDRCRGGAVMKRETPYYNKKIFNQNAKVKIAKAAMEFIDKDDTVFLDAGTTTYQIAQLLADNGNITVITDDLQIAMMLSQTRTNVFICGGCIQKTTGCVMGMFANQMIENFFIDVAFIGTAAIDKDYAVCTPTIEKIELKRKIIKNSSRSYLVADVDKFDRRAALKINTLSDYNGVITDKKFPADIRRTLQKKHINIISV